MFRSNANSGVCTPTRRALRDTSVPRGEHTLVDAGVSWSTMTFISVEAAAPYLDAIFSAQSVKYVGKTKNELDDG